MLGLAPLLITHSLSIRGPGAQNLGNAWDLHNSYTHEAEVENLLGKPVAGGSMIDDFFSGFFGKETFSSVGRGGSFKEEAAQGIGATLSSFIPLLAPVIGGPFGAALLFIHGASSITSGIKTFANGFETGNYMEFVNGAMYFADAFTGGYFGKIGEAAKTAFSKQVGDLFSSYNGLSALDGGMKSTLLGYTKTNGGNPSTLMSELLVQGEKHKDWGALRALSVTPQSKLSVAIHDPAMEVAVKHVLSNSPKIKAKAKDIDKLYEELREKGKLHELWQKVAHLKVDKPSVTLEAALNQRSLLAEEVKTGFSSINRTLVEVSKEGAAKTVQASGSAYEQSSVWLRNNFTIGRQSVAAQQTGMGQAVNSIM